MFGVFTKLQFQNEGLSFTNSLLSNVLQKSVSQNEKLSHFDVRKFEGKSANFCLNANEYAIFIENSKKNISENTVLSFEYKGSNLMILNMDNSQIQQKIEMILKNINANIILLQDFPRDFLVDIEIKNPKSNLFSNRNYLNQLSWENYKSQKLNFESGENLKDKNENLTPKDYFQKSYLKEKLKILVDFNPLFVSLPFHSLKHNFLNSYTLPQVFTLYMAAIKEITSYSGDDFDKDLREILSEKVPDTIMRWEDQYLASIIEYLVARKTQQKICVLSKSIHFETLIFYLQNRLPSKIEKEVSLIPLIKNEFRDLEYEEYADKLALIDTFLSKFDEVIDPIDNMQSLSLINKFVPEDKRELCLKIYNHRTNLYLFKKFKLKTEFKDEKESEYLEKILII